MDILARSNDTVSGLSNVLGVRMILTVLRALLIVVTVMHLVYAMGVSFTVVHPAFVDSESKGMETQRFTTDSRAAER